MVKTSKTKSGYLPSLDGWRAIAVLGVMFTHDYDHHVGGHSLGFLHDYGGYGVLLFFAISGMLITTRILEEEQIRGHFDLRAFYVRRFFRIQPAAVVYLLIAALMVCFGFTLDGGWKYWWGSMLFFRNYLAHDVGPFSYFAAGHFWTLAVEEHFYLLLSLLLFTLRKNRIVVFLVVTAIVWRLPSVLQHQGWINPVTTPRTTQENLRYLFWPALCAVLLKQQRIREYAQRYVRPWSVMLLYVLWIAYGKRHALRAGEIEGVFLVSKFVTLFPIMLVATILQTRSWTTRLLEAPPFRFVGRISYSLYLWHVIFFLSRWGPDASFPNPTPHWFTHAPWNYLPAFALASASYYLLEKPMMRLGHRLAPPASPGRPELAGAEAAAAG